MESSTQLVHVLIQLAIRYFWPNIALYVYVSIETF